VIARRDDVLAGPRRTGRPRRRGRIEAETSWRGGSGLLDATSASNYAAAVTAARDEVVRRLGVVRRPFSGATPAELDRLVGAVDLDVPLADPDEVLREVGRLYLDDAVWFHHPRYAAHLNCPIAIAAVAADVIAGAVNSSLDTWDQSAGATLIERRLVAWTADRLGFGPDADGVFTSGGSQSNLQALLLARESAPTSDLTRLRVLSSVDSHFSLVKSAQLLGLGRSAVVGVAVDDQRRMSVPALEKCLTELVGAGLVPMAVVGTAGTTDFGAVDPLPELGRLASRYGAWLHVDAAYGGGLMTSARHSGLLAGSAAADSITVDFHKTFFQPVASSVVLVRDRRTLRHVAWHADYLNPADDDPEIRPNQVDKSLQTTRRFDALKLWCTLRTLGPQRIGSMLDSVIELADAGYDVLRSEPDFEVVTRPQLSTLVFRFAPADVPSGDLDVANRAARAAMFDRGEAVIAGTKVDGRYFLKLTLLNPATTLSDIRFILDRIREHAGSALTTRPRSAAR
jgi:L-2,4-diaminobutyrate decarboxylase